MSRPASHIFICYSSKDETVARQVVDFLESDGLTCWISCRDVPPGQNYQETIVQAVETAQGMVFLFSESSSKSTEIRKELSIAASVNVPVFPLRLDPIIPSGALRYELATRQWVDMFPDRDKALAKLVATIKRFTADPAAAAEGSGATAGQPGPTRIVANEVRTQPHAPIVAPGSKEFEAIRALLARHIGPIAKVFVEKAATQARTPDEFCERLATHVAAPSDRTSFLRDVRASLSSKS